MNYDEMKKDAAARSSFVKLEKGIPSKVKFLSENFKKIEKTFNEGQPNENTSIKYEIPCVIDGEEKLYQGSAKFYENCMQKATNRKKGFLDLTYIITKNGEGLGTTYDIDVVDLASEATSATEMPMTAKAPPEEYVVPGQNVPF